MDISEGSNKRKMRNNLESLRAKVSPLAATLPLISDEEYSVHMFNKDEEPAVTGQGRPLVKFFRDTEGA